MEIKPKPHYQILDALRGVAALMVVAFHIMEAHSDADHHKQIINHGYLAVDFFFLLSGFVIGYAYDDRWNNMSIGTFFKRRLIRLQPMVVISMIIAAIGFYFQDSPALFPGIHQVPVWKMLGIMLIGMTLIPVPTSMDIRGWGEMHPLNGPAWSLFFEYIANILYGLWIRRFSKTALSVLVLISAAALIYWSVISPNGDLAGGWSLEPEQFRIGFTRLMFPFFGGLLLSRVINVKKMNSAFLWSSLLLILVLSLPRIGDRQHNWQNGLYESLAVILVFPLIVMIGAGASVKGKWSSRLCKFLGEISYPIYITHYVFIYIYTAWVVDHKISFANAFPYALLTFLASISVAYLCLKLYDMPIRKWLSRKWLK